MANPSTDSDQVFAPSRQLDTPYPLIDNDPHFKRVCRYARPSDCYTSVICAAGGPSLMLLWERVAPSHVGKGGFASIMRVSGLVGLVGGFGWFYSRSIQRFYGFTENKREVDMDMREMVDKVKKGEPLYGHSTLTPHMQGVAARNSRYSGLFIHVVPWANFVNHNQHGVDTAKYYQQAEREMAAEDAQKA